MQNIAKNIIDFTLRLRACEKTYQRPAHSVNVLAVSKGQGVQQIREAIAAGQKAFGENYVQEALLKISALADPTLEWHFIGALQSNKIKKVATHFQWVHTVSDRVTATRLNAERPLDLPPLNICLQVKLGNEPSKKGAESAAILSLAHHCLTLPHLHLRGLMVIPPFFLDAPSQHASFKQIKELFDELQRQKIPLDTLSMGMSNDWEAAVAEGSTFVRIGTIIFGARN